MTSSSPASAGGVEPAPLLTTAEERLHWRDYSIARVSMSGYDIRRLLSDCEKLLARSESAEASARTARAELETVEDQRDSAIEALQQIESWSQAYPLDIFPEPDFAKAHELLMAGGITLDAVSASCMRRVVEGVGKIASAAIRSLKTAPKGK